MDVKCDVVNFARTRWPIKFSRLYAAQEISSGGRSGGVLRVAINSEGLFLFRDDWSPLFEFSYADIVRVSRSTAEPSAPAQRQRKKPTPSRRRVGFVVVSWRHGEKRFASPNASEICRLVGEFLDGLRSRSRYVVATRDAVEGGSIHPTTTTLLYFEF